VTKRSEVDGARARRDLLGDQAVERHLAGPVHAAAPELTRMIDENLFGEIWQDPALTTRERALVTVAALSANGLLGQLRTYTGVAVRTGVDRQALVQTAVQLAFYIGFPAAGNALAVMVETLDNMEREEAE